MRISISDSKFLTQLIIDCETYNLREKESLEYLERRFGKQISRRTYYYYKNKVKNEENLRIQTWADHHARVGFILYHKKLIESLEKSFDDTSMQLLTEIEKPYEERDDNKILKLKAEQRLSAVIIQEFALGTPVVMKIKEKIEKNEKEINQLRRFQLRREYEETKQEKVLV